MNYESPGSAGKRKPLTCTAGWLSEQNQVPQAPKQHSVVRFTLLPRIHQHQYTACTNGLEWHDYVWLANLLCSPAKTPVEALGEGVGADRSITQRQDHNS